MSKETKEGRTSIEKQELEALSGYIGESKVQARRAYARANDSKWWDEYPVDIKTFVEHDEYLHLGGMVWESVQTDLGEIFDVQKVLKDNRFSSCQEAVLDEAIGSGKSFLSSIAISYIVYRLLCLKNPAQFYGLASGSLLAVMNMSPTASQAKNVVFGEIKARIDCSTWFRNFGGLDDKIRSVLRFAKGVTVLPGNSSESFPLGYNLIAWIMDEAAFFTDTPDHDVAEEIYYTLMRRSQSRFRDRWLGIMISSPRYVDDFIERKMEEAKKYPELIYSKRRAIWESKPDDIEAIKGIEGKDYFVLEGTRIPIIYKKAYIENPDKAWRDLGAIPSLVLEPYFKKWSAVEGSIDQNMKHPVDADGRFFDWFRGSDKFLYYIHIDLALVSDSAGIAMTHKEEDLIIVDMMIKIKPTMGREIDLKEVREIVYECQRRGFNMGKVTYDQFQSAESIQELNKRNIISEQLSMDRTLEPYETFKEMVYSDKVRFYREEDFLIEMKRLELVKGKKVDHPAKGSKDLTDAVGGAVYNAVTGDGNREMFFKIV